MLVMEALIGSGDGAELHTASSVPAIIDAGAEAIAQIPTGSQAERFVVVQNVTTGCVISPNAYRIRLRRWFAPPRFALRFARKRRFSRAMGWYASWLFPPNARKVKISG